MIPQLPVHGWNFGKHNSRWSPLNVVLTREGNGPQTITEERASRNHCVPSESSLIAVLPRYHLPPTLLKVLAVPNLKDAVCCTGTRKKACKLGFAFQQHHLLARQFSSLSHICNMGLRHLPMRLSLGINEGMYRPQHSALHKIGVQQISGPFPPSFKVSCPESALHMWPDQHRLEEGMGFVTPKSCY